MPFLQARLNVSLPGLQHQIAQSLVDFAEADEPYSKAAHGNIEAAYDLV